METPLSFCFTCCSSGAAGMPSEDHGISTLGCLGREEQHKTYSSRTWGLGKGLWGQPEQGMPASGEGCLGEGCLPPGDGLSI